MEERSICVLDMNTIGLFNYLTELDEEQKQRKQEIDRVIDRIHKERFKHPTSITFTTSFELTEEEREYIKRKVFCGSLDMISEDPT